MRTTFSRSDASFLLALALLLATCTPEGAAARAEKSIAAAEAGQHVNEQATVCGLVAGAKYASQTRGRPTFLDFEKPHPAEVFRVLIWGSDRDKFKEPPEATFNQKRACVTGRIQLYRGAPEIVVRDPAQLTLDDRVRHPG
jgi:hypothetical protein